jgi:hypothetical protein
MLDDGELYIYLGAQNNTFFFLHTIYNTEKFKQEMSYQIYNTLIHEKYIQSPNQNVIVFDVNKTDGTCTAVCMQHYEAEKKLLFRKENLERFFPALIKAKKKDLFFVKYDYNINGYLTYEIENFDFGTFSQLTLDKISINNLIQLVTKKSIKD